MAAKPGFRQDTTPLTSAEAEELTENIAAVLRRGLDTVTPMILRAFRGRAWNALGFTSWAEYCGEHFTGEGMLRLPDSVMFALSDEGMSTRSIAAATNRSKSDVDRSINKKTRPADVISIDGYRRPATSETAARAAARAAHPAGKRQRDETQGKGLPAWQIVTAVITDTGTGTYVTVCDALGWRDGKVTGAISEASRRGEIKPVGKHDGHVVWGPAGE